MNKRPISFSPLHPLTPLGQLFHFLQGNKICSIPANVLLRTRMGKKCVPRTKAILQRLDSNKSEVTNRMLQLQLEDYRSDTAAVPQEAGRAAGYRDAEDQEDLV